MILQLPKDRRIACFARIGLSSVLRSVLTNWMLTTPPINWVKLVQVNVLKMMKKSGGVVPIRIRIGHPI